MARTIGVVGGLGPEGTVHYYRKLAKRLASIPVEGRPGIVIDHLWMERFAALLRGGATRDIAAMLGASLDRLHRAGAELALVAAVTPHKFLDELRERSTLPIVDLVEATRDDVASAGYRIVGLLGTRATLTEPFFRGGLERAGIEVVVPDAAGIAYLDDLIFGPLASGSKTPEMANDVAAIVNELRARARCDALVVACTDLMDLVSTTLPIVDAVECHVRAAAALASAGGRAEPADAARRRA
jgi:aspartate racemase